MDGVCNFIFNNIDDTCDNYSNILQDYNEYTGDMSNYVITYLNNIFSNKVTNHRIIVENEKTIIKFVIGCRNCEIRDYTTTRGEDYWIVSISNS